MTKKFSAQCKSYYFDFYISKHIINNRDIFKSFIFWVSDFTIAEREIIRSKRIRIVTIFLSNKTLIKLQNIIYRHKYNSNLILLG